MEITGRLTADAKVSTTKNDKQVVNFSLVINDYYKAKDGEKKQIATYFNCDYWVSVKVAENLKKGTIVLLYGRPGVNAYKDMQGEARARLTFHVNNIKFVGGGKGNAVTTTATDQTGSFTAAPETIDDLPF